MLPFFISNLYISFFGVFGVGDSVGDSVGDGIFVKNEPFGWGLLG